MVRSFQAGDLVWSRLLGMDHELRQAWAGPLEVVEKLKNMNYKVKEIRSKGRSKVIHIKTLKKYVKRQCYWYGRGSIL